MQDMTTAGSVIIRQSSTKSAVDDKGLDDRPPSGARLCCGADPLLVATIAGRHALAAAELGVHETKAVLVCMFRQR